MTIYTDVFGGANIYPSDISYRAVTLAANTVLRWPEETSAAADFAARIMDVSASSAGLSLTLPDATGASPGETILFNNTGASSFIVKDAAGVQVVVVASGEAWQVYLTSNTTAAGVWRSFQYGAGVSSANASALAGTGIVAVGSLLSQSVPITQLSISYVAQVADRAKMYLWVDGLGGLTLPNPASVGNNWFILVRNSGFGAFTVDTDGTSLVDGISSKTYQPGESSIIISDGVNYYTLGFGQAIAFAFDYTAVNVSGSGSYVLTGAELNRVAYKFTGTLTGDRTIIVPPTVQQYWIDNATVGGYLLRVEVSGGGGVYINPNSTTIVYSEGSTIVPANNSSSVLSTVSGGIF